MYFFNVVQSELKNTKDSRPLRSVNKEAGVIILFETTNKNVYPKLAFGLINMLIMAVLSHHFYFLIMKELF